MRQVLFGLVLVAMSLTGCNGAIIAGTPEGLREVSMWQNGIISNARIDADKESAYYEYHKEREVEETNRCWTCDMARRVKASLGMGPTAEVKR